MSFGRVVHEDRQAREQAYRDAGKRCAARIAAAGAWVARHMPECVDEKHGPNSLVIAAAMGVSDARGFEHVTPDAVRARLRAQRPEAWAEIYDRKEAA